MARKAKTTENGKEFISKVKIYILLTILLFAIGTIMFYILSDSSIKESFFRTLFALAFIFEDDSTIPEKILEISLTVVGLFLLWWVLWGFADMVIEGHLSDYIKHNRFTNKIRKMQKHTIIVGGGRIGSEIAKILHETKKPFIIIESDTPTSEKLKQNGYTTINADALEESSLMLAELKKASKLIITLPKIEDNIMLTLGAKDINEEIEVHSRCENPKHISKLKRAGASNITVPEFIAAHKMADDLK